MGREIERRLTRLEQGDGHVNRVSTDGRAEPESGWTTAAGLQRLYADLEASGAMEDHVTAGRLDVVPDELMQALSVTERPKLGHL